MIVTIPILLFFLYSLFRNYSKSVIVLIVLSSWLSEFKFFGYNLMLVITVVAFLLFPYKYGITAVTKIKKFPLILPFLMIAISLIMSNYFAVSRHTPTLIMYIINSLFIVMIGWFICTKSPDDSIRVFIKIAYLYGSFIGLYSLFETLTRSNPYIYFINSIDAYRLDYVVTEIRYGLKRTQSIFSMHTTSGAVSLLLFCFLFFVYLKGYLRSKFTIIIVVLLAFSVISSGSRALILGLFISSIMFFNYKCLRPHYLLLIFLFLSLLFIFTSQTFIEIYNSFFDTKRVAGSNVEMRMIQYEIAADYMKQSFWFGNGLRYTFTDVAVYDEKIFGAESIWFSIMIDQGIIGIIAYIVYFLSLIIYCVKKHCSKILFLVIGFFLANTISSLPNFQITYIFLFIFILTRLKINKNNQIYHNM